MTGVQTCALPIFAIHVQLPMFMDGDAFSAGKTDFPDTVLEKVYAKTLPSLAPIVAKMYSRFSISNVAASELLNAISNENRTLFEAACRWLKADGNSRWKSDWLPIEEFSCEVGSYKVPDTSADARFRCDVCAAGYFSKGGTAKQCTACPPGEFQSAPGQFGCINCDSLGNFYNELYAQPSCTPCALNTQRYLGLMSGTNRTACMCKEGYYNPSGRAGEPCEKCPPGYSCMGKATQPERLNQNVLKLGILLDMSEPGAMGPSVIGAVELAVNAVNSNPDLLGGKTLTYIWRDEGCDAKIGMAAASRMLEEDGPFDVIIGPSCSVACESTGFLTSARNLLQISHSCTSMLLSDSRKYPTFVKMASSYAETARVVPLLMNWAGWQSLASFHSKQEVFALAIGAVRDELERSGRSMSLSSSFEPGSFEPNKLDDLAPLRLRLVLVLAYEEDMRVVGLAAWQRGMVMTGWAWIAFDTLLQSEETGPSDELGDSRAALDGWLYIEPLTAAPASFFEDVRNASIDVVGQQANGDISVYAAHLFDAILLFSYAAARMLERNLPLSDGDAMMKQIGNVTFAGETGWVSIDMTSRSLRESKAVGNYLRTADNKSMVSGRVFVYDAASNGFAAVKDARVRWPGGTFQIPVDKLPKPVCSAGFALKAAQCAPCAAGFYARLNGSEVCSSCEDLEDQYQDQPGQTFCRPCPENTRRDRGENASKSIAGCVCKDDFFAPLATKGYECKRCPQGGICDGKLSLPYAPFEPTPIPRIGEHVVNQVCQKRLLGTAATLLHRCINGIPTLGKRQLRLSQPVHGMQVRCPSPQAGDAWLTRLREFSLQVLRCSQLLGRE